MADLVESPSAAHKTSTVRAKVNHLVHPRAKDDRGSALVELTWLGILLLVPMLWIVLSVFDVQRGAFGVSSAARAAGRAYALAPTDALGRARAEEAARQALADQGLGSVPIAVTVSCTPYPRSCHQGTSVVTVRVATRVDLPLLPEVLGGQAPTFALDASHSVPVGEYQEVTDVPAG
jgi:Flp pilus assembly protein TadG